MAQMIKKKKKILPAMQVGVKVAQPYLTPCNPMDNGPPGSSVHGDFPGKNTGVDCHSLLQGSSCPGDHAQVSCIAGRFLLSEPPGKPTISWVGFNFLGWEDLLEKGMAAHSSILAWRIPGTEEPGRL